MSSIINNLNLDSNSSKTINDSSLIKDAKFTQMISDKNNSNAMDNDDSELCKSLIQFARIFKKMEKIKKRNKRKSKHH
jgi:hypothetical protein